MIVDDYKRALDKALDTMYTGEDRLSEAVRYALTGGKRLRGVLALISGRDVKSACAVEMVHAFSLIHDDLPCMDNDDFRRGKPSCHKQYGEALALLAGDLLLAEALGIEPGLAVSAGEIIYGQSLDMEFEKAETVTEKELLDMYSLKTASLFQAACAASETPGKRTQEMFYGHNFGMAFQITDDLLDYKTEKVGKKTLPLIIGEEAARAKAAEYVNKAARTAEKLENGKLLKELAQELIDRSK